MQSLYHHPDRDELVHRLQTVSPDSARRWGRMTPHQMHCHLSDTLRITLGERSATPNGNWVAHTLVKSISLRSPLPWPKGVKSSPELDCQQGGTPPTEFEADRAELIALIGRCADHHTDRWPEHPYFGPMSRWDWGRFNYRHIRHHLRQFGA